MYTHTSPSDQTPLKTTKMCVCFFTLTVSTKHTIIQSFLICPVGPVFHSSLFEVRVVWCQSRVKHSHPDTSPCKIQHSVYTWHQSEGGLTRAPAKCITVFTCDIKWGWSDTRPWHEPLQNASQCLHVASKWGWSATSPMSNTVTPPPVPCQTLSPCHQSHVKHCHPATSPMSNTVTLPPVPCQTLSPCHQNAT